MYMPTDTGLVEAMKRAPIMPTRNRNMSPKYNQPMQPPTPNYGGIGAPTMAEPMPNVHPALLSAMRTMPMGPGY